jgi:hypothetical protein
MQKPVWVSGFIKQLRFACLRLVGQRCQQQSGEGAGDFLSGDRPGEQQE